MTYKIRYLPLAVQDLNEIARYLSGFYPKTASRVLKELRDKTGRVSPSGGTLPFAILHRVWYTQLNNSEVGMEIYMRNYEIENEMYRRAVELIETRYPVGWGGAGVVHTSKLLHKCQH